MHVYLRPVRFEDVDAAHIVFFPRFFNYCHEAMETLFDGVLGGYVGMVRDRRIGVPAVHVDCDYTQPLRYGDVARIEVTVEKIGRTSLTFRYAMSREKDGVPVATVRHTCVMSDLVALKGIPIPDDIRAVLEKSLV